MYAVIEYKGKQYKAEKDALLQVDKTEGNKGDKIDIDSVLLVSDGDKVSVGTPYVKGAKVTAEIEDSFRDKKVLVFKCDPFRNFPFAGRVVLFDFPGALERLGEFRHSLAAALFSAFARGALGEFFKFEEERALWLV